MGRILAKPLRADNRKGELMNATFVAHYNSGPVAGFPSYKQVGRMVYRDEQPRIQMTRAVGDEMVTENVIIEKCSSRPIHGRRQEGVYTICPVATASTTREGARIVNISADVDGDNASWYV
jgi:hypothetical protein